MTRAFVVAVVVALPVPALALAGGARADGPPLWGGLEPGPHVVGFTSWFELDATRRYQAKFADGTTYAEEPGPRPILVNLWYPAAIGAGDAEPMPYRDYLDLASDDPRVARFAAALVDYDRDVMANELLDQPFRALDARKRAAFDALLDTPTGCLRDAEPDEEERHPLVIYHSGYGSSFEDDAVLCEWLASHGYVVAGSAFQAADGSSFNIDAAEGSARDFEYLVATLAARPEVDASRVALIGHSGGAHTVIRQAARPGFTARAIVSLDTTQDYWNADDRRWNTMLDVANAHVDRYTTPMLFCASPHAIFSLPDRLVRCERWCFTAPLDHNDFITQGILAAELAARSAPLDAAAVSHARDLRASYSALCRVLLRFLDAKVRGVRPDEAAPGVEVTPIGVGAPPAWAAASGAPPTPRQFRPLLSALGRDEAIALLRRVHAAHPDSPLFHPIFAFSFLRDLHAQGRDDDVKAFGAAFRELVPELAANIEAQGDFFARRGTRDFARECFEVLQLVDPENSRAAQRLKELEHG